MTTEVAPEVMRVKEAEKSKPVFEVSPFDTSIASIEDLYAVFELLRARYGGRMPLRKNVESEEGAVADLHRALRQYAGTDFIVARDGYENIIGVATGAPEVPEEIDDVYAPVEVYKAGYLAAHPCYEGQGVDEELARVQIARVREWGHRIMSFVADPLMTKVARDERALLIHRENGVVFAIFPVLPEVESGE